MCDLQADRMDEFAGDLSRGDQIKRYTDYREMCRDPEIDAIFVGTPNQLHVPVALEAVRRDKHVMVTKPLADGERPATKLVKAAEAAGVVNMMSLSTRFNPQNRYLQDKA
ncbi:MAG TPA: oxidoreductase, partial [Candidatus Latescibacteria bacterium]|nr:oxidoreductase [Candidatus Latescibacterota bacterium]